MTARRKARAMMERKARRKVVQMTKTALRTRMATSRVKTTRAKRIVETNDSPLHDENHNRAFLLAL